MPTAPQTGHSQAVTHTGSCEGMSGLLDEASNQEGRKTKIYPCNISVLPVVGESDSSGPCHVRPGRAGDCASEDECSRIEGGSTGSSGRRSRARHDGSKPGAGEEQEACSPPSPGAGPCSKSRRRSHDNAQCRMDRGKRRMKNVVCYENLGFVISVHILELDCVPCHL